MILYNTLMGICAATILLICSRAVQVTGPGETIARGYGVALLILGAPLTFLAGAMVVTWPLTANPPINIAFGEPCLMLGVLALAGGVVVTRTTLGFDDLGPVLWIVGAVGVMLAVIAVAILRFNLVGDAPAAEPITGRVKGWENTTFGLVYLVAAAGCLLTPWITKHWARTAVRYSWLVAGIFFLAFSALNYYTHIGMLINLETGTNHRW